MCRKIVNLKNNTKEKNNNNNNNNKNSNKSPKSSSPFLPESLFLISSRPIFCKQLEPQEKEQYKKRNSQRCNKPISFLIMMKTLMMSSGIKHQFRLLHKKNRNPRNPKKNRLRNDRKSLKSLMMMRMKMMISWTNSQFQRRAVVDPREMMKVSQDHHDPHDPQDPRGRRNPLHLPITRNSRMKI